MDKQKMALIGQYLLEKDKKEWSEYIMELIKLNDMMYSDSDEDYSDSEGSAVSETQEWTYTTEDEQGFLSLA
mgnify:FL=1|tara:strand:+ start:8290 stop:8505 length:216 start_codon:yes stop_codon:yes gene_type:complete